MAPEVDLKKLMIGPGTCLASCPTEIRVRIFELAFAYAYFQPVREQVSGPFDITVTHLSPAIMYMDRDAQEEAKQVLYSRNPIFFTFGQFLHFMRKERQTQSSSCASWIKRMAVVFSRQDFWTYTGVSLVPLVSELQNQDSYYARCDSPSFALHGLKVDVNRLGWLPCPHFPWAKEVARCIGRHLSKPPASISIVGEANHAERRCMEDIMCRARPQHDLKRWGEIQAYWGEVTRVLSSTKPDPVWENFVESGRPPMTPTFPWIDSLSRQPRGPSGTRYREQLSKSSKADL